LVRGIWRICVATTAAALTFAISAAAQAENVILGRRHRHLVVDLRLRWWWRREPSR